MSNEITVAYGYRMEGHYAAGKVDAAFYRQLPGAKEDYRNTRTGRPEMPRPDVTQLITVIGSAVLSSSVLAAAVKSWLQGRRTKITISVSGSDAKVVYEGPNFKEDRRAIEKVIDKLSRDGNGRTLQVSAEHMD